MKEHGALSTPRLLLTLRRYEGARRGSPIGRKFLRNVCDSEELEAQRLRETWKSKRNLRAGRVQTDNPSTSESETGRAILS